MAMELEQSGEAFYRAVVPQSDSPEIRALFEDLAEQETQHYKTFANLVKTVQDQPIMTMDEWDEYLAYLKTTIQNAFFEGPDKALAMAKQATSEKEAIRIAMNFEKDTVLFFHDLHDMIPQPDKGIITRIIDEEKLHIRRLAKML